MGWAIRYRVVTGPACTNSKSLSCSRVRALAGPVSEPTARPHLPSDARLAHAAVRRKRPARAGPLALHRLSRRPRDPRDEQRRRHRDDQGSARKILEHLDLDATGPPLAAARRTPEPIEPTSQFDVADPGYDERQRSARPPAAGWVRPDVEFPAVFHSYRAPRRRECCRGWRPAGAPPRFDEKPPSPATECDAATPLRVGRLHHQRASREPHRERRSARGVRLHGDLAPVRTDDLADDEQAEPHAARRIR